MKANIGIAFISALMVWGCSTDQNQFVEKKIEKTVYTTESAEIGVNKTIANLGIEGMACEKACGGSIKKALMKMDGVITADIKFDVNEEVDFAVVEFDESKVTSEEMVQVLSELNKGQFTIKSIAVEKQVFKSSDDADLKENSPKKAAPSVGEVKHRNFKLPNVFDVLNGLLR